MKDELAKRGYEIVNQEKDDSDSDSDDPIPGRIRSREPNEAREKGKKAFEQGKYDKAIKIWQGGLKSILSALCSGPEAMSNQSLSELDLTLNLNIAMAYMKKGDYEGADRSVEKALNRREALPPHQITKALYRKAMALRAMHKLEECIETLKDLLTVETTHAAAQQMLQEVEREWSKQCREQKRNLKKLFSKLEGEDKQQEENVRRQRKEARQRCAVKWVAEHDVDSEAYEHDEAKGADGKDWGLAMSRSVLWAIEQFAVEDSFCLPATDSEHVTLWFIGASTTCELRWLLPMQLLQRLPSVQSLDVVMIGFLGELDPDNKRVPDPKVDALPVGRLESTLKESSRRFSIHAIKGTLQEALEQMAKPGTSSSSRSECNAEETTETAADEQAPAGEEPSPPIPAAEEQAPIAPAGEEPTQTPASHTTSQVEAAPTAAQKEVVPPTFAFIAHPQLHRYYTDFFPAITWLVEKDVPTAIIGASEPDPSWKQDEVLLKALGAKIVVGKRVCPYPMCLPDNPDVRKCSHIIGFKGGKALERDKLTKVKLELLTQDYSVR